MFKLGDTVIGFDRFTRKRIKGYVLAILNMKDLITGIKTRELILIGHKLKFHNNRNPDVNFINARIVLIEKICLR